MTEVEFAKWSKNGNFTISQERILTVSNHIAECEHDCYTKAEVAQVAMYHALEVSKLVGEVESLKTQTLLDRYRRLVQTLGTAETSA